MRCWRFPALPFLPRHAPARKGDRQPHRVSAGFAEGGEEGREAQRELARIAARARDATRGAELSRDGELRRPHPVNVCCTPPQPARMHRERRLSRRAERWLL